LLADRVQLATIGLDPVLRADDAGFGIGAGEDKGGASEGKRDHDQGWEYDGLSHRAGSLCLSRGCGVSGL
jgi:hypothetical protein